MKFEASFAAVLLAGAFAVPAFAQETIAGMTIPEVEMSIVENHCAALAAAERVDMGEPMEDEAAGQDDHEENPGAEGGDALTAGQGNVVGRTSVTETDDEAEHEAEDNSDLDVDAITLADCEEAGFADAAQADEATGAAQ